MSNGGISAEQKAAQEKAEAEKAAQEKAEAEKAAQEKAEAEKAEAPKFRVMLNGKVVIVDKIDKKIHKHVTGADFK